MIGVAITPDDPFLSDFVFDLTIEEQHTASVTKTAVPVEQGAPVADHVVVNPSPFSCTVMITNTPIKRTEAGESYLPTTLHIGGRPPTGVGPFATGTLPSAVEFQALTKILPVDRVQTMAERLNGLLQMRKTLTVFTSRRTYRDMILMSVSDPVTHGPDGDGIWSATFALMFEPLKTVYTDSVAAPKPKEPKGQGATSPGKKDPKKGNPLFDALGVQGPDPNETALNWIIRGAP